MDVCFPFKVDLICVWKFAISFVVSLFNTENITLNKAGFLPNFGCRNWCHYSKINFQECKIKTYRKRHVI